MIHANAFDGFSEISICLQVIHLIIKDIYKLLLFVQGS